MNIWKDNLMDLDWFVDCIDGGQGLSLQLFRLLSEPYNEDKLYMQTFPLKI